MILRIISFACFFAINDAPVALASEQDHDGQGTLRGTNSDVRKLSGNLFNDERELSGRVIISRKTEGKLKKQGKNPNEIAAIRSQGMSEIKKNKVVFESSGEGDFQVVEVGKGKEAAFIENLMNGPRANLFEYAEQDYIEHLVVTPDDPELSKQYHHDNMQSNNAWDITTGSSSITIAICDTGLQLDHPDLAGNRLPGYQATTQTWEVDGGDVTNVHPHGTMCAGCAAAIGNNTLGLSGVGWNFKHRPGRVSDASTGSSSSAILADCARKMCELPDVKVASVSYSGVESTSRRAAAAYCKTQGALMVNAAGNDGRDLTQYGDADNDDLIVAGASNSADNKASFSAYGRFVDVWAPGRDVWTTTTGSGYQAVSGTSFSCPLTAGLIALIWSVNPDFTPDEVEDFLKLSTDDVGIQGQYNTAYGRINSYKAVEFAASGTLPPVPPPTPPPTRAPTSFSCSIYQTGGSCKSDSRCLWNRGSCQLK